jgi:hypothetical protein
LVGPEESGSGVPQAGAGCHFAEQTPLGPPSRRGTKVAGFPAITVRSIPARDATGTVRPSADIIAACRDAVHAAEQTGATAVLHLLDGSKTGYVLPDPDDLRHLARRHASTVRVIVDACQSRGDPARIADFLAEDWIVLITGSKFYGGPPFSGAVLIPPDLAAQVKRPDWTLPSGLAAYTTRADWPEDWAPAMNLPEAGNPGLLLRWQAALVEMAEFQASPRRLREARLLRFATALPALIGGHPNIQLLETPAPPGSPPSIFSFRLLRNGHALNLADARRVHFWLFTDISGHISGLSAGGTSLARRA